MDTKLLYMEDMQALTCSARIQEIQITEGRHVLILDRTIFYPQGGGQPYDIGMISSDAFLMQVQEVRLIDGQVFHIGFLENGECHRGAYVQCTVDTQRRLRHTRLHSAGHIVDMGLKKLGISWIPGKGYHFPDGPYVEYTGNVDQDIDQLKTDLESVCNTIIASDLLTTVHFADQKSIRTLCEHVPKYISENKPARVVLYGNFGVLCGGTHVKRLGDIGSITIRKIKQRKGVIKVSYQIS